jgi:hypothetical protein
MVIVYSSVVDPKLLVTDPDPTFQRVSDPDPDPQHWFIHRFSTSINV